YVSDIDAVADEYPSTYPLARQMGGWRATVAAPLLQGDEAIGVLSIYAAEPHAFTERQITLLEAFADQAVIAIENARLFEALEQRNAELQESNRQVTEALEQQTALAEVLRVIAASPTDVQPVLDALVDRARRLSDSSIAVLNLREGDQRRIVAHATPLGVPSSV